MKPHNKTGILWLRLRTPKHLADRREELARLGANYRAEFHRSLETRDPKKAVLAYSVKRTEIEAILSSWERLLRDGPVRLSHKNLVALAGEHAKAVFELHESEPFDEPPEVPLPEAVPDDPGLKRRVVNMPESERMTLMEDPRRLKAAGEGEAGPLAIEVLRRHEVLQESLAPALAAALEAMVGDDTDAILNAKGLHVDALTRSLLNLEGFYRHGRVLAGLRQRQSDDWGDVEGLHGLPAYEPPAPSAPAPSSQAELTFEAVIAEEERLSGLKLAKHIKSPRTLAKYRQDCERFCEWRGSRNMLTVSRGEVAQWRDHMLNGKDGKTLRHKTIVLRVNAVQAVINWAIDHNKRRRDEGEQITAVFPRGNPIAGIDLPAKQLVNSEDRTLGKEEVRRLLQAARAERGQARRWVPWLIAYSGMRLSEACKLERKHVQQHEGHWYLVVQNEERSSTKNRPRRIPLHKAILAEGFLEFVTKAPNGPLFPGKFPTNYVRKWAHRVMDFDGRPPFHGMRHLFGDMATGKLDFAARCYVEGRALPGSAKDYGRSVAMVPELARMIDSIEPLLPINSDRDI